MKQLIVGRWLHRKRSTLFIFLAFSAFFFLIPFLIQHIKQTELTVQQTLEQQGRGQYDLLVRPSGSRSEIEQTTGTVAENYIGDGNGGISLEDWREIQAHPSVELAAPVASIGYFSGEGKTIALPVPKYSTLFSWSFQTTDGIHMYSLPGTDHILFLADEAEEGAGYHSLRYIAAYSGEGSINDKYMFVHLPKNYSLLAGIDPHSEERLIGQPLVELFNKEAGWSANLTQQNVGSEIIKVIKREGFGLPLYLSLKASPIELKPDDVRNILHFNEEELLLDMVSQDIDTEIFEQLFTPLLAQQPSETETKTVDLSRHLSPFEGTPYRLDDDFVLQPLEAHAKDLNTGIYYTADKVVYQQDGEKLKVFQIGNEKPPVYKEVHHKGSSEEIPYLITEVATFKYDESQESGIVSSPLGIYATQETLTNDGKQVIPTIMPGSFVSSPAAAITDIESAALIKGNRPIDAIRVKVTGAASYNAEIKERIDQLSVFLLEKGYEVDVVAGSSFVKQTLDVEGLGEVVEPWTTLGVAQSLQDHWSLITLLQVGLLIVFSLVWISTRNILESALYREEKSLLQTIGWSSGQVNRIRLLDQGLIFVMACVVAIGLLAVFRFGASSMALAGAAGVLALLTCTVTIYLPTRKINIEKRSGSFRYYLHLLFPMTIIIFLTLTICTMQVLILADTLSEQNYSTLGNLLTQQTGVFQLAILTVAIMLALYSLWEGIDVLLNERKNELKMYKAIGWTAGQIRRFIWQDLWRVFGFAFTTFALAITTVSIWLSYPVGLVLLIVSVASGSLLAFLAFIVRRQVKRI